MARIQIITVALLMLAIAGCNGATTLPGAEPETAGLPPTVVHATPARMTNVAPRVTVVGTITPVRKSVVASGAAGVVEQFLVDEGDYIEADTPLSQLRTDAITLEIDKAIALRDESRFRWDELKQSRPEKIAEAEARMLAAAARKLQAERTYATVQKLKEYNATTATRLTDVSALRDTTSKEHEASVQQHKLVAAGPREEVVRQAELRHKSQCKHVEFLQVEKSKHIVTAPFAGFVVNEQTEVGQWLDRGDPVITLVRLDEVDVIVNVDQWQLRNVRQGDEAEVVISGVDPERWTGTIVSVVPQSEWESGSRGFPARVRLKNSIRTQGVRRVPLLTEGMMASVTFRGRAVSTLLIHKDALLRTNRGSFIHVFQPGDLPAGGQSPQSDDQIAGSTRQYAVNLGISHGEWINVSLSPGDDGSPQAANESPGLKTGDLIVTEGGERLRPVQGNVVCHVQ